MKDLGLIPEGYKIMVVGTVQEEDCDGMCWQYIHNETRSSPEFVVSTEPTDGGIYRGHRGRMEIRVDVKGISCHGSAPERGDNAIYKMADILQDVEALNENGAPTAPRSRASSRCSTRSLTPSTTRTRASWAAAPAPSRRSSSPPPPAAPWRTPARSRSTAA
jgi:putative selenium metabolism hydrolase